MPVATNLASWVPVVTPTAAPLANRTRLDCSLTNNTRYCTLLESGYYTGNLTDDPRLIHADYPSNAAPNSTEECKQWYETMDGDTSESLLRSAGIALDAFYAWNPSVKSDCSNVWLNTSYCISGPGYDDAYYLTTPPQRTPLPRRLPEPARPRPRRPHRR
ncbi:hypothetical protein BJY01DRAFT_243354 [Aspergillus pseudoustus]|uniref:LysM domain-containing protein n=1 Tax=Aspergillus pseudoustus TaxID=1810923 RepID=A0ABR4KUA2_9EURO